MTIIIYLNSDKTAWRVIKPVTDGPNKFDGNVRKLVEHLTHSNFAEGEQNYYRFEVV